MTTILTIILIVIILLLIIIIIIMTITIIIGRVIVVINDYYICYHEEYDNNAIMPLTNSCSYTDNISIYNNYDDNYSQNQYKYAKKTYGRNVRTCAILSVILELKVTNAVEEYLQYAPSVSISNALSTSIIPRNAPLKRRKKKESVKIVSN